MFDVFWRNVGEPYDLEALRKRAKTEFFWLLCNEVDYTGWDLQWDSWTPDRDQRRHIHAWGSHGETEARTTLLIPRDGDDGEVMTWTRLLPARPRTSRILEWPRHVFSAATATNDRMEDLRFHTNELKVNYCAWWRDPLTDVPQEMFDWLPPHWEQDAIHVFCFQGCEQMGYLWWINGNVDLKTARLVFHASDLRQRLDSQRVVTLDTGHGLGTKRFVGDLESMIPGCAAACDREWLWITCDSTLYDGFDFTWRPDRWNTGQIHCWPSGDDIAGVVTKGDTLLIHMPTYRRHGHAMPYNFDHQPLPRRPWPVITHISTLPEALAATERLPHVYTLYQHRRTEVTAQPTATLWQSRPVISLNASHSTCLVPRDCIVPGEIYAYPTLVKNAGLATEPPLDVIFIDNGERDADINWQRLVKLYPAAKRSSGVKGRLRAYKSAAAFSDSEWFLAVFAKCWMESSFKDFAWRPDYWQLPKHYIFHNRNGDTGNVYGHMAPIAYHKALLWANRGGLDMTLTQSHAVIPLVLSSTSLFNDSWLLWRTAFREYVKLSYYQDQQPTLQRALHMWKWRTQAHGQDLGWQARAVKDAQDYYDSAKGDPAALELTNEWHWLEAHFDSIYGSDARADITHSI